MISFPKHFRQKNRDTNNSYLCINVSKYNQRRLVLHFFISDSENCLIRIIVALKGVTCIVVNVFQCYLKSTEKNGFIFNDDIDFKLNDRSIMCSNQGLLVIWLYTSLSCFLLYYYIRYTFRGISTGKKFY